MNRLLSPLALSHTEHSYVPGLALWLLGWMLMLFLDQYLDLGNLGMLLVLTSAVAAVWLPATATLVLGVLSVMAFNWTFVPPKGTFAIDLHHHAMLLIAMFVVNLIIAVLMVSLREHARRVELHAIATNTLRAWGDRLRDVEQPGECLEELRCILMETTGADVSLMALRDSVPDGDDESAVLRAGGGKNGSQDSNPLDKEQSAAMWYCLRNAQALGPGTGRYENLADRYFPMRGKTLCHGAALVAGQGLLNEGASAQVQALCDQMGAALERSALQREELRARQAAREQTLRTTFLAAISHDYRTPLATILGAASSLEQQGDRLDREQQRLLAHRIREEAEHLRQITSNILQLARLDMPGLVLHCDWESAEELVGSVVQRHRGDDLEERFRIEVEPGLPLLWCDPLLVYQLLDNLLDNACKFATPDTPITLFARRKGGMVSLGVRDQGPGIPVERQQHIFELFQHHPGPVSMPGNSPAGAGIGLALCLAIAKAHGGELHLQSDARGSCFECLLPVHVQPPLPADIVVGVHTSRKESAP